MSQADAERLRNLREALALAGVGVTPSCATLELEQHLRPGFRSDLGGKFIPQILDQLKAFEFAKMLDGLQCRLHSKKSSTPLPSMIVLARRPLVAGRLEPTLPPSTGRGIVVSARAWTIRAC